MLHLRLFKPRQKLRQSLNLDGPVDPVYLTLSVAYTFSHFHSPGVAQVNRAPLGFKADRGTGS